MACWSLRPSPLHAAHGSIEDEQRVSALHKNIEFLASVDPGGVFNDFINYKEDAGIYPFCCAAGQQTFGNDPWINADKLKFDGIGIIFLHPWGYFGLKSCKVARHFVTRGTTTFCMN